MLYFIHMFRGACFCVCRRVSVWSVLHVSIGVCGGQGTTLGFILRNAVYLLCGNISYLSCMKNSPIRLAAEPHGVLRSLPLQHESIRMLYHTSQSFWFCNSDSGHQVYVTNALLVGQSPHIFPQKY